MNTARHLEQDDGSSVTLVYTRRKELWMEGSGTKSAGECGHRVALHALRDCNRRGGPTKRELRDELDALKPRVEHHGRGWWR